MEKSPEKDILERAQQFDAQALSEIFDHFSPGIYRYAYRLLGDEELAQECMSETFSRFLGALKRDSGPDHYLQAYLYRIAHNWVTDHFRSKAAASVPLETEIAANTEDEPHEVMAYEQTKHQLREALTLLTPEQRQVIVMKYLEGWENDAIARILNKPVGAIKALQHRGLDAMRRILLGHEDI